MFNISSPWLCVEATSPFRNRRAKTSGNELVAEQIGAVVILVYHSHDQQAVKQN
jgi:hypothetical protein